MTVRKIPTKGTAADRLSPMAVLGPVLDAIGLSLTDAGGSVRIDGDDPVVDSRHRPGAAAAAALAAQGLAAATIWRMRRGQAQDIAVDARQAAVVGLRTINHVRQNGVFHELYPRGAKGLADFYRTRDGRLIYILRASLYIQTILDTLSLLGCSYEPESMAAAVAKWDALALEDAISERKLVGVIARSREEWLSHPQGRWLAARPMVEIEKIGDSSPEPFLPAARPLSDVRVLDFTHVLAGPVTGRTLAEQGADVLHICAQHQLDPVRINMDTGVGKRSAFLDIDTAGDAERLRELARDSDLFVQSWRPSALATRGFAAEDLARLRPGIVYVSVSCYGSGGPWADRGGYEPCGQTACGLVIDEGSADAPRMAVTGTLNDYLAGYLAAAGALGALIRRAREGGSYHVKVSLTRTSMWIQELGRLPQSEWPTEAIPMDSRPSDLVHMASPFGIVTVPAPITRYSATKPYWTRPPEPYGASPPSWVEPRHNR